MKLDLKKTTFIIPVRIDSDDRLINAELTLDYLIENLDTNIILYESSEKSKLSKYGKYVKYIFEYDDFFWFHKTKILNKMSDLSTTPVIANYDIDVLLPLQSYIEAQDAILDGYDLAYPFELSNMLFELSRESKNKLKESNYDFSCLDVNRDFLRCNYDTSTAGYTQFLNSGVYRIHGRNDEHFVNYSPEDQELYHRFNVMEKRIFELKGGILYHLCHERTLTARWKTKNWDKNLAYFEYLKTLTKNELIKYHENHQYLYNKLYRDGTAI